METGDKEWYAAADEADHHDGAKNVPIDSWVRFRIKYNTKLFTKCSRYHGSCHTEKKVDIDRKALGLGVCDVQQHSKTRGRPTFPDQIIETNHDHGDPEVFADKIADE